MLGHFDSKMSEAVLNAKDAESALEFLKDLEVRPEVMKRAIENPISGLTLPDILEKNRKEVIYDIKQQVNSSLMNGDRYETAAEKLVERLDFNYGKAANIVRTETHRVIESGFMDCAKDISESIEDSEFVYAAIWHNMNDERVRPQQRYHTKSGWKTSKSKNGANHQKMEGKIIQVGDKFQLEPGVYAECPGNSGTARNDCRCRCFLEYTLLTKEEFLQKGGKLIDKSVESGIIRVEKQRGIDNMNAVEEKHTAAGNRRSPLYKLTDEDIEIVKYEIKEIDADADKFVFNSNITRGTCFLASDGKVHIKGNVFPDESSNHPRDKMSIRAVIAHEYYGHRPYRDQYLREDSDTSPDSINKIMARAWADEFRASYMAAKNAPSLSDEDRYLLIRDSLSRAEEAGVTIKYNDFIRRVLYG